MGPPDEYNQLSGTIVDCAYKVHTALGPGLIESVYEACMLHELRKRGVHAESQVSLPIVYDDVTLDAGLRLDIWVERKVIVELKAIENLLPIHKAQLLTYLKLSKCRLGLLINFNSVLIKDGIQRLAL